MLAKYYLEVDLICIIVLSCLMYQTICSNFTKINKKHLIVLLLCHLLFIFSDCIWIFNNGYIAYSTLGLFGYVLGDIGNSLNIIMSGMTGLSWLFFSESMQNKSIFSSNKRIMITVIPELILILLVIMNKYTHMMFEITKTGEYVRYSGYAIQILIGYGYIGFAVILSLHRAKTATNVMERKLALTMACFVIAPSIACIVQLFFSNMSILFIGTVLAVLNVYMDLQAQLVSNDALTGLNNRSRLDQKIYSAIKSLDNNTDLWLLIMDANRFKSINDTYGHLEGDHALILIADALREECFSSDFICRYGGDEFIVLHKTPKSQDCTDLINRINNNLSRNTLPYNLSVSIGSALYTKNIKDWNDFIRIADEELYKVKTIIKKK